MSNRLVSVAKDNGSTDNITIVVVFLKPLDQLRKEHKERKENPEKASVTRETLYKGVKSTSKFIPPSNSRNRNFSHF